MVREYLKLFSLFISLFVCFIIVSFFYPNTCSAETLVWQLSNTTDCSGQGGDGQSFDNLCYNQNGVNSTTSWIHNNDPAILINTIKDHSYKFSVETDFVGTNGDFIANHLIDASGYNYSGGKDWICPTSDCSHDGWEITFTALSNTVYFLQGSGCSLSNSCFTTNLKLIDLTETPITKTVFVPGLGASWSLNDFINCTKSSNRDNWSLAPYAKSVYTNVLAALQNAGWTTLPFYYDWRQNVSENSQLLSEYIKSNTSEDEKLNLVGHSMGGLVGRGYMEEYSGGKLSKYYSAGTPHQGSSLSYAPWEGGEVWTNNLIEKIGIDLYLKHCGGINSNNRLTVQSLFPSIQNLLPTLPYLRDKSSENLKEISSMKVKNNFITDFFVAPFWNVKVGTLSGNDQKTLDIIKVINPSKFDIRLGNWIDGVPVSREYTNEGDGTVLNNSSQLLGAFQNDVISQSHRGLVGSTEGINSILSFLGSPGIDDPPYSDDTSALILIGYPGDFKITNEKGETISSENGMIAVMNPTNSNYQIQFDPNNSRTTLIVDQFLANGQTSYKEYKYSKAPTDVKILEFNSKRVNINPIHEVKEYKKPHFPIFWHGFWKWWIRYRR